MLRTRGRTWSMAKVRKRALYALREGRSRLVRPASTSGLTNLFHCCVHKTGSQWIRHLLADWRVYKYSGLRSYQYQSELPGGFDERRITERRFSAPFPSGTIVSPLYIDHAGYRAIPTTGPTRGFFVQRDPRDIVVSWYFSSRFSHPIMGSLGDVRQSLSELPIEEGLAYSIGHLANFGTFDALRSWALAQQKNDLGDRTILIRFEDMVGEEGAATFARLFDHCGIVLPRGDFDALLHDHSFAALSGRDPGDEDQNALMRKGLPGDWTNHFTDRVAAAFAEATGDLVHLLGY